jgi:CBS domain-containing protein
MRRKGVGGIPVVDDSGRAVGSIMIKDVKHLLTASETNRDYRSGLYMCFIYMATSSISETLLLTRIQNLLKKYTKE